MDMVVIEDYLHVHFINGVQHKIRRIQSILNKNKIKLYKTLQIMTGPLQVNNPTLVKEDRCRIWAITF